MGMNIAVIAGGTSTERDVSLSSGKLICASLRRNGHNANMIDVFLGSDKYDNVQDFFNDKNDLEELASELGKMSPKIKEIETERKEKSKGFFGPMVLDVCKAADIVYIGLHGSNGEDGKIQAAFDLFGIKYTGTDYLSSAISMDKHLTKKMLATEGVPVPKGITLKKGHKLEYVPFPCVVKPCCGGSSVIDGKALPVIEIEPLNGFYDYKNKYSAGATKETCPAKVDEETSQRMQRWAEKACEAAGIKAFARVDELMNEDGQIFCLEINTLPGMTATSLVPQEAQVVGISYDELTQKLVELSLAKYE